MRRALTIGTLLLVCARADALPVATGARVVGAARELLGVEYVLGGRLKSARDGIDCQGLIFYGLERINRCGWRSYSVMPTESVAWRELGAPVAGLSPVATARLDGSSLQAGDVVFLLAPFGNPAEPPLAVIDGSSQWVWHTGLATDGGSWIHADYVTGRVREEELRGFLVTNSYSGVFILRMDQGPAPRHCRSHAPMRRPQVSRRAGQ
jgi:hypothetical protein